MIDMNAIRQAVEDYYGNLPHPNAPSVKVKDYPAFAKVAMALKDGFPDGGDVENAHAQLKALNMSPSDFEYVWNIARPLANQLLGRDPHMVELSRLHQASPGEIYDHYYHSPHPQIPTAKAGELAQYYHAARPLAQQHAGRDPNHVELLSMIHGQWDANDIVSHYQSSK